MNLNRKEIEALLLKGSDHLQIFEELSKMGNCFSEFIFYLRFFAKETEMNFFHLPVSDSEDWDVLMCYYQDSANTLERCWKEWIQSKLFLMTSCSHFVTTLSEKIYAPHTIHTKKNYKEVKKLIKKGKADFYIRLESENHVMLLDFPRSLTKQGKGALLQSVLYEVDCEYKVFPLTKLLDMVKIYEIIFVGEYDVGSVVYHLKSELENCFCLLPDEPFQYFEGKKQWKEILNFVDLVNDSSRKAARFVKFPRIGMTGNQEIVLEHLTKAYLKDFDWKVQLLTASDKLSSMQVPHLLLSLTIVKQDKSVEELQLELSKDELDSLLGSLAKARRVVSTLRI